jgi:hypothetical protein
MNIAVPLRIGMGTVNYLAFVEGVYPDIPSARQLYVE